MSMYLDLDDCVAGNPQAEKELTALRAELAETRKALSKCYKVINRQNDWDSAVDDAWKTTNDVFLKYPKEGEK